MRRALGWILLTSLSACYSESALPTLVRHAAREHGCSEEQIQVIRHGEGDPARRYVLSVCGQQRTYVDTGRHTFDWQDVTAANP